MEKDAGLGDSWAGVMDSLRQIIPVYDRVNRFISLGRASAYRSRCIAKGVRPGDCVLDAGSGFGNMSQAAQAACGGSLSVTMYDPLVPMLQAAGGRFDEPPSLACGIFEEMPFRGGQFDAVMCGYSLRDAIRLREAISEAHRVLKPGGRMVIADLGKPDCRIVRAGVAAYLRLLLPVIALAAGGRLGLRFGSLYGTFARWPENRRLEALLLEKFSRVEFEKGMLGGAIMVAAYK